MAVVEWKRDDTVAVIKMVNGENRFNPVFNKEFLQVFDEIEKDMAVKSVVIVSTDAKSWSQGIDLIWMQGRMAEQDLQAIRSFLYGLNDIFKRILLFPMPVICAINGHAVAGGAILSLACDFRFMKADKGFFFFSEVDVGIPFVPGMMAFCRKAVPEYKFEEMMYTGKRYGATEMEAHHVVTKACLNEEALMAEAMAFARTFNKKRGVFGEMKRRMHKHIIDIIDKEDREYIEPLKVVYGD
ncbi:MAG: enoyl-CoA hydratase/isomerase family protein [Syntrophales bacterium]